VGIPADNSSCVVVKRVVLSRYDRTVIAAMPINPEQNKKVSKVV
jgi:hypothetical protein